MTEPDELVANDDVNPQSESSSVALDCTPGDHSKQYEDSACMIILSKIKGLN